MEKGDFIKIDYEARITNNNQLFDTTKQELAAKNGIKGAEGPVPIIVGERYVIEGLDDELEKHKVGDEFEINIIPERAFGTRKSQLIKTVPLNTFKKEKMMPAPGMIINFGGVNGKILSVSGGRVRVDFNHPLAGKAIKYKTKITQQITKDTEKIRTIIENRMRIKPEIKKTKETITITTEKEMPKQAQEILNKEIQKYVKKTKIKYKTKKQ